MGRTVWETAVPSAKMLKSITSPGVRDQILEAALTAEILIGVIDPGTNCAIRYIALRTLIHREGGQSDIAVQIACQTFFHGATAGDTYSDRMAMLYLKLQADPCFLRASFYIIEEQFENNVMLTVGVLVGIITALRAGSAEIRVKRSGNQEPVSLPYTILTSPCQFKTYAINAHEPPCGKISKAEIKDRGVAAALKICERDGDVRTIQMITSTSKADDIADTVCHEWAIRSFLYNPASLALSKRKARGK
jgi:hypothetical protein